MLAQYLHDNLSAADVEQSIPSRFEQQVRLHGSLPAVRTSNYEFSYDTLNALANRVAHRLLAERGPYAEPVALLFDYDAQFFPALFGVLKAGKYYLPLDPSHPRARLAQLLADSEAGFILCDAENRALARSLAAAGQRVLVVDTADADDAPDNPGLAISPDALANLVYTSGSTGLPKGVLQQHRNQLHLARNYGNSIGILPGDRHSLLMSLNFGGASWAIYATLMNGACLCPKDLRNDGMHDLPRWLAAERITHCDGTPTIFRHFLTNLEGIETFPDLRVLNLGGEPLRRSDVEAFRKVFHPPTLLRNGMGSTETGADCHFLVDHTREFEGNLLPAGYPNHDKQILLLDDDGNDVGFNRTGQIVIRSRYLSPGYWRNPGLTAERFRVDPDDATLRRYRTGDLGYRLPDGCLVHLGRQDFQVKIRGHRIELPEIEGALLCIEGVRDAVLLAREDQPGEPRLVAYVVRSGAPLSASTLRAALAQTLPEYMLPAAFVMLDALPRTPSAKIDRAALPPPGRDRPALSNPYSAPATPVETQLCDIWGEVLRVDGIGTTDRFLELGGDSLLAAALVARVLRAFAVEISLAVLLGAGTIREMGALILAHQVTALPLAQRAGVERLMSDEE